MKKSVLFLLTLFCAAILIGSLSYPSFAAPAEPKGFGSGYNQGTIVLNGKSYDYNVWITADRSVGYMSHCKTSACIARQHNSLSCKFDTENFGYQTNTGGSLYWPAIIGESTSYAVQCPLGMGVVTGFPSCSTSVVVYADVTKTLAVSWW